MHSCIFNHRSTHCSDGLHNLALRLPERPYLGLVGKADSPTTCFMISIMVGFCPLGLLGIYEEGKYRSVPCPWYPVTELVLGQIPHGTEVPRVSHWRSNDVARWTRTVQHTSPSSSTIYSCFYHKLNIKSVSSSLLMSVFFKNILYLANFY